MRPGSTPRQAADQVSPPQRTLHADPDAVSAGGRRTAAVALCCVGAFLAFLDSTIVNIAFPNIVRSFAGTRLSDLSWILNAYNVVIAAFLVPAGGVADRFGNRRSFGVGLVLFAAASGLCAAAPSVAVLIAARLVQAVGAAVLIPTSLALLLPSFPPARRLTAVSVWGASAALAAGIGPTVGGALVDAFSWRAVFLVNVPIALAAAALVPLVLRAAPPQALRLPDLPGAALLAVGLGLLALGIVQGHDWGWTSASVVGSLAGGVVGIVLVVLRSRRHPAPVVRLDLLRGRTSAVGNLGTLLFSTAFYTAVLNNVLFLTGGWHWSILSAALATTPSPLLTAVVARPAGHLADRRGPHVVVLPGVALYVGGVLLLAWGAGRGPDFTAHWLPGALCVGAAIGLALPTLTGVGLAGYGEGSLAVGSAVNAAARQIGGVLGTAVLVSLLAADAADPLAGAQAGWYFAGALALASAAMMLALPRSTPSRSTPTRSAAECPSPPNHPSHEVPP